MVSQSDDDFLDDKVKQGKEVYAGTLAELDELEQEQEQVLEEEKQRAQRLQLEEVRKKLE